MITPNLAIPGPATITGAQALALPPGSTIAVPITPELPEEAASGVRYQLGRRENPAALPHDPGFADLTAADAGLRAWFSLDDDAPVIVLHIAPREDERDHLGPLRRALTDAATALGLEVDSDRDLTSLEGIERVGEQSARAARSARAAQLGRTVATAADDAADGLAAAACGGGYDVVLDDDANKKISVIKAVRAATKGLGLGGAKWLVDHAPGTVLRDRPLEAAHRLVAALDTIGARSHVHITGRPDHRVTDGGVTVSTCGGCEQDTTHLDGLCSDCQIDVETGRPAGTFWREEQAREAQRED